MGTSVFSLNSGLRTFLKIKWPVYAPEMSRGSSRDREIMNGESARRGGEKRRARLCHGLAGCLRFLVFDSWLS